MLRSIAPPVAGVLVLVTAGAAYPQDRVSPLQKGRVDFVLGNVQFALLHELAHLVISELDVPIVGPEEQAADYLATISLLRPMGDPPVGRERWLQYALTTADAFVILWQLGEMTDVQFPYWDSHALSIQRFYTIGCLLYGSSPSRFSAVPALIELPMQRAQSCEAEYARAVRSVDWLVRTFARAPDDPQPGQVSVRFDAPPSRTGQFLVREIQSAGLIEWTLRRLTELITLSEDVSFVMRSCRMPEAAWVREDREIVFCYELLDFYYSLSSQRRRHELSSLLN